MTGALFRLSAMAAARSTGPPPALSANFGAVVNQTVLPSIATLPLTDQHGHVFDLALLHGRNVVLVPFSASARILCSCW